LFQNFQVRENKTELIDGMNITGIVSLDKSITPAVPNESIVEADSKYYIFVQTDKKPEEHKEEAGHDDQGHGHDEGETDHGHKNETEADLVNVVAIMIPTAPTPIRIFASVIASQKFTASKKIFVRRISGNTPAVLVYSSIYNDSI